MYFIFVFSKDFQLFSFAENLFNLKFSAKQLEHLARKSEKDTVTEKQKIKLAIQKSNMEGSLFTTHYHNTRNIETLLINFYIKIIILVYICIYIIND